MQKTLETELDEILQALEKERASLQTAIAQCLEEWDYLGAHYHSIGLKALSRKLQTLNNLRDRNFDDKQHLIQMIQALYRENEFRQGLKLFSGDEMRRRLLEEKLEALQSEKPGFITDTQVVFDLMNEMKEGVLHAFELHLSQKYGLVLKISCLSEDFLLSLLKGSKMIHKREISELHKIGFTEQENRWELALIGMEEGGISNLEKVLSRIVFDVFYFRELDNPMKIKVL